MSASPAPTPPQPTIRALIADYRPDPPTITPSTDREAIAKVIRQGGQCVWLDVSHADSATLDWVAQTLNISAALLALDAPFYECEPFLVFNLPVPRSGSSGWQFSSALIAIRGDTLLTLSRLAAPWAEVFHRTERHLPDWHTDFNKTFCELVAAVIAVIEQVSGVEVSELQTNLINSTLSSHSAIYVSDMLDSSLRMQSGLRQLHDRLQTATQVLCGLKNCPVFETDQDVSWKMAALADRWESNVLRFSKAIDNARDFSLVLTAQQTAQMSARMRGIAIALLIALPAIVVALWAIIFPIQATDLRLVVWAAVTVVAVVVSLALGSRAGVL